MIQVVSERSSYPYNFLLPCHSVTENAKLFARQTLKNMAEEMAGAAAIFQAQLEQEASKVATMEAQTSMMAEASPPVPLPPPPSLSPPPSPLSLCITNPPFSQHLKGFLRGLCSTRTCSAWLPSTAGHSLEPLNART